MQSMTARTARCLVLAAVVLAGVAAVVPAAARTAPRHTLRAARMRRAPKLGHWTTIGSGKQVVPGTPAVWMSPKSTGYALWLRHPTNGTATYELAKVAPKGAVTPSADIFKGANWTSLTYAPAIVSQGSSPLLVFNGAKGTTGAYSRGCVYGALGTAVPWQLQTWSLSADCVNPIGGSVEGKAGVLATAFPGGWNGGHGVEYRVGTSPTIPATGNDSRISLTSPAVAARANVGADAQGNGDFYVVWSQAFSSPASHDGYYVKDVSANTAAKKVPNTGTNTTNHMPTPGDIAIANTNTHGGEFVASCNNATTCSLQLWKVGAKKAVKIPGSASAFSVSIAAAPGGRLWIAWYNSQNNRVFVTRTNKHDTRFGAARSYATPCVENGLLGLSGGPSTRLDVALECVDKKLDGAVYVTQALVSLHVSLSAHKVTNTSKHKITVTVTDVGDPIAGATVHFDGHNATTNSAGKASFTLAKNTAPGKYKASASKAGYLSAGGTVTVTK